MKRENFQSRIGFLLVSAGCAIGIGNVWRFPYVVGINGGGVFVLFYLLFLICMGVPILTMELAVGRASRQSAVKGYQALEKPGHKWHIHGWFCLAGCYLLMMYYTTVCGWMMIYFGKFLTGAFSAGMDSAAVSDAFGQMLLNPGQMLLWMAVTVVAGFLVCSWGLKKGLERVSKWMMVALLLLIVVLAIHSITLPNAGTGLAFYLLPDFERVREVGLGNVMADAMNQSFFTLSLGIGAMEIFGSYMSRDHSLPGESLRVCAMDTFVAFFAGLIIFPACFSFGLEPNQGPPLIFQTLPNIFVNMTGGRVWGALFFLFMTFASFTTVIAVFENIIAGAMDNFGWSRKKASVINGIFLLIASVPCVLGYNVWSDLRLIGGRDVLDSEDFLVSNLLLPLGSLVYLLFCVNRWGWGFDQYLEECNSGAGIRFSRRLKPYFQYVLPILILVILLQGLL